MNKRVLGTLLTVAFFFAIALVITAGVFAAIYNKKILTISQMVEHHSRIINEANDILSIEKDLNSGGYSLTGDSSFLDNYFLARKNVFPHIDTLRSLTLNDSYQQARIDSLLAITNIRIDFAEQTIAERNKIGYNLQSRLAAAAKTRGYITRIRELIAKAKGEETSLLKEDRIRNARRQHEFNIIFTFLLASTIVLLVIVFLTLRYNLIQRTNAERSLQTSEARLQLALDGTSAGIWDWDLKTNKRWWSPTYYAVLGYNEGEINPTRETVEQMIHPDDAKLVFDMMENHLKGKSRFGLEYRMKTKNDGYKWFLGTGQADFDDAGKATRMVGSIVNIDERRKAQSEIEQQAALIQMLPDGIIYGNGSDQIISINKGAERMFDVSAEEAIGKEVREIITYKLVGRTREAVRAEFDRKGFLRQELEIVTKAGNKMNVLASVQKFKKADLKSDWVGVYTDITPLRMNEELKAANVYLEQFAYISSHDIKAPILTLNGLNELLLKIPTLGSQERHILEMERKVIAQMERTTRALHEVLELRQNLVNKPAKKEDMLPLQTVIDNAIATITKDISKSDAKIDIDLGNAAGTKIPAPYMQIAFKHLLANAIKFRDQQKPLLIEIKASHTADGNLHMSVKDNGIGFDLAQNKHKLYGLFKRFHGNIDGVGVGLHMVKSVITAYDGEMNGISQVGAGATFEMELKKTILAAWN